MQAQRTGIDQQQQQPEVEPTRVRVHCVVPQLLSSLAFLLFVTFYSTPDVILRVKLTFEQNHACMLYDTSIGTGYNACAPNVKVCQKIVDDPSDMR